MTSRTLILRSLRHHARSHLGVLLGAAVGSAVLIGALLVGDSVRESLRRMALERLGAIHFAVASNDRLFRSELAADMRKELAGGQTESSEIAPALQLPGTATSGGGAARANEVQVLGVDESFWKLAGGTPPFDAIPPDKVILNAPLAEQIKVKPGDSILIRVAKPAQLSRDAPLSPEEGFNVALRLTVHAIAAGDQLGNFSLQANQVPPFNAFVSLAWLQQKLETAGKANLLLAGGVTPPDPTRLASTLKSALQLADAQLKLVEAGDAGAIELRTERVFIDDPVVNAAASASPESRRILTYFVNEIRADGQSTPYSMVTAAGPPLVPADMRDDEILINQWLADDLKAKIGDEVKMTYYIVGTARQLEERTNTFRVRAIVPMKNPFADRTLMPDFPGMTDAENCRDWDTGFPVKMDAIRDKDEHYWDDYKGTPKAFVTLAAGQAMWSNRFGDLTAIRYPVSETKEAIAGSILKALDPASVGLVFQPVREQALAASGQALDFGQLFLGFSFFLIIAALLLMSLLFQFGIEQRAPEVGTLLAVGFTPKQVRRLLLAEGALLALIGSALGMIGGIGYARAMLHGLSTIWRDAVGTSALHFHATVTTLAIGAVAGVLIAVVTIWFALRKQAAQPARELLSEGAAERGSKIEERGWRRPAWISLIAGIAASLLIGWAMWNKEAGSAGAFFGAGALLLIASISFTSAYLGRVGQSARAERPTLGGMGLRNATRRRKRSLATVAMLACGSFLVVAVGANKLDAGRGAEMRSSGTGGFAFIGKTTLPVVHNLNAEAGREYFGLEEKDLAGVAFVPFRVREGDDASCLNLNRPQKPRILGTRAEELAGREAFTFAKVLDGTQAENPWLLLNADLGEDVVPAIGDMNSILWSMGKKLGDDLIYLDEQGREFRIRLVAGVANSILQGSLIIAEKEFVKRFPSESGYRMFLVDAPSNGRSEISATLSRAMQDVGLELVPAERRLAAFNAVQNTYLSTFQVLGGLGLILGSIGLGIVVLRNVLERRGELALLMAVGFRPRAVRWVVVSEHGLLLLLGLAGGVISAVVAVLPALLSPGAEIPYGSLAATLAAVFANGALWTWFAARIALRGRLLDALRNE